MKRYLHKLLFSGVLLFAMVSASFADVKHIDNTALEALIAEGVPVIDVRRIDEWQATYDAERWLAALNKIAPKGKPVVLICAAGVRSKSIAELLDKRLGYTGVHNHMSGMNDWIKAEKPVIRYTPVPAMESGGEKQSE